MTNLRSGLFFEVTYHLDVHFRIDWNSLQKKTCKTYINNGNNSVIYVWMQIFHNNIICCILNPRIHDLTNFQYLSSYSCWKTFWILNFKFIVRYSKNFLFHLSHAKTNNRHAFINYDSHIKSPGGHRLRVKIFYLKTFFLSGGRNTVFFFRTKIRKNGPFLTLQSIIDYPKFIILFII